MHDGERGGQKEGRREIVRSRKREKGATKNKKSSSPLRSERLGAGGLEQVITSSCGGDAARALNFFLFCFLNHPLLLLLSLPRQPLSPLVAPRSSSLVLSYSRSTRQFVILSLLLLPSPLSFTLTLTLSRFRRSFLKAFARPQKQSVRANSGQANSRERRTRQRPRGTDKSERSLLAGGFSDFGEIVCDCVISISTQNSLVKTWRKRSSRASALYQGTCEGCILARAKHEDHFSSKVHAPQRRRSWYRTRAFHHRTRHKKRKLSGVSIPCRFRGSRKLSLTNWIGSYRLLARRNDRPLCGRTFVVIIIVAVVRLASRSRGKG